MPDFLIIGAQRCGTTSLYDYLTQHPCVRPAARKELHFFDNRYGSGVRWYRAQFPLGRAHGRAENNRATPRLTGEATPYYLFHPAVPQRVHDLLPAVKLIVLLRDPVERARSHYFHALRKGYEQLSLDDAICHEPERLAGERERLLADPSYRSVPYQHYSYAVRGIYVDQLVAWQELFPPSQLLVIQSEALFAEPARHFSRILSFLGLPPWLPTDFPVLNRGAERPAGESWRSGLRAFFRPHNERLYDYLREIGQPFERPWEERWA